ncbi:ribonuclease BN (tRNA processing enzyme) [Chitinivorax tropicus]|uniref:Ribonuclease BN (tRNA processing enzyme) n=1 Tax=Chitinivorax tropicus TaxID=714531 RepID=A0A840MT80_9PROT|nr:MBL fold metallo-hydrolase [Chitinivorax tropicus]MBB5019596.1 ribonuclease BN (tRNA processing enzyme) [Chitinivorax tropicus]
MQRCLLGILMLIPATQVIACPADDTYLQVLGSGGPELTGRAQTSYLVWDHGKARVLIDAGPGSAINFGRARARFEDLQAIALTHLHTDHSADIVAFIKAGFFENRDQDLPLFGPDGASRFPATTEWAQALFDKEQGAYRYLARFVTDQEDASPYRLRPQDILPDGDTPTVAFNQAPLKLTAVTVGHGAVPALAWRVDLNHRAVVISGDTNGNGPALTNLAKHSGLLVAHNAVPEGAQGVERALHMPPSRIGEIAAISQPARLVLSHRMRRTLGQEQQTKRAIRQAYHGPLQFANDLDCIRIPATP